MARFILAILMVLATLVSSSSIYAGGNGPVLISKVKVGEEPFPIGSWVRFNIVDGRLIIASDRASDPGYIWEDVAMEIEPYMPNKGFDWNKRRTPRSGDLAIVVGYHDWGTNGKKFSDPESWKEDGLVDRIDLDEVHGWTPEEAELLSIAQQFTDELEERRLFMFWYATDCAPSQLLMDGRPVEPGPYGLTYRVPSQGGQLVAYYDVGSCWETVTEPWERWSIRVRPGDWAGGTESVSSSPAAESFQQDPWSFCRQLRLWLRPQWQPQAMVSNSLADKCGDLYSRTDIGTRAILARLGFADTGSVYGRGDPVDQEVFVIPYFDHGQARPELPGRWQQVDQMVVSEQTAYEVYIDQKLDLRAELIGVKSYGDDIPWLEYGNPIAFVPKEDILSNAPFDWGRLRVFRVVRSGWSQVTIHELRPE